MRNRKRIVFILIFVFVFVLKNQSIYSTTISNSRINNDNPRKRKFQSVGVQKELRQGFYKSKKESPTKIKSQIENEIQVMNSNRKEKKNLKQQTECLVQKDSPEVIGTEFRVNNFISGTQTYASIASIGLYNTKFVITWSSDGDDNDGSNYAILAKFYNSTDGSEIGEQFLVNTHTSNTQYNSKVRSILNGEKFVIAWESNNQDGSGYGIYLQIFDSNDGSKVGGEILVNSFTDNAQSGPRICSTGQNGERFVVTWQSNNQVSDESKNDIYAQIFDSTTGNKIGSEFLVNTNTTNDQRSPDICSIGENGTKIVIVWESGQDKSKSLVYAQILNSEDGSKIDNEFLVNTNTVDSQRVPAISSIGQKNEKFVISWSRQIDEDQSGYDIHAQVYDSNDGSTIGAEFKVNTGTTNHQILPAISSIGENKEKFVITWQSYLYDSSGYGIYAQIYESNEISKIGEEFRVNTYTSNNQNRPQISSIGQNLENFIISWLSKEQDGDGTGVYAQILTTDFICNCNKGSYSNATNPESCFQCPLGTYQAEVGKTGCLECQSGQYQDKEGQSKCLDCEIGTYQDLESQSTCKACGNGTYQNSKAQTKCLSCRMGTYGNDDGLSECKLCPKGTYQNDEGQTECIKCQNGTINPNQGSTSIGSCVECELGSYQNQEGASECLQCPDGTYGNVKGAVVCQECSTGSYSYQIGSTVCSFCTTGTYQNEIGMINCKTCPFNEYQDQVGSNKCNICPSNSETLSKQSASNKECFCMIGYYGKPGENCKKCPDEGICNEFNQHYPYPTSGYWSSNDDPYELIKCSIEIACPGYEVEKCNDTAGYTGSKCSECLNGFYKLERECEKCPSNSNQRLFLILLVVFFFLLLLLFFAKKATAYFGSFTISFSFFQILLIIYQLNINWPTLLNITFKIFLPFNFNLDFLATECSFSFDYFQKWFILQSTPLIFLFFFILVYCLIFIHSKFIYRYNINEFILNKLPILMYKPSKQTDHFILYYIHLIKHYLFVPLFQSYSKKELIKLKNIFINVYLTLLTLIYLILSQKCLEIFNCKYDTYSEKHIFQPDVKYYCYDEKWYQILPFAITSIVIYIVGIPILIIYLLIKNSKILTEKQFDMKFGLLCSRYNKNYFFWEIIIMLRKLFFIIIILFLSDSTTLQLIILILILISFLILQFKCKPYLEKRHNFLETILLAIPQLILFSGLIFYSNEFNNNDNLLIFVLLLFIIIGLLFLTIITFSDIYYKIQMTKLNKYIKNKQKNSNDNTTVNTKILNSNFQSKLIFDLMKRKNKKIKLLILISWYSVLTKSKSRKLLLFINNLNLKITNNNKLEQLKKNNLSMFKHLFLNDLVYKFAKWYDKKATLINKLQIKFLIENFYQYHNNSLQNKINN